MYTAYFVNIIDGWLYRSSDPRKDPHGNGWMQITEEQYNLYVIIQSEEYA